MDGRIRRRRRQRHTPQEPLREVPQSHRQRVPANPRRITPFTDLSQLDADLALTRTLQEPEHLGIIKSERKRICRLFDCRKLSADACMHAVQNERLPLRVVVQVLFFEHVRAVADEDWDAMASTEELRALRGELAALRLGNVVRPV